MDVLTQRKYDRPLNFGHSLCKSLIFHSILDSHSAHSFGETGVSTGTLNTKYSQYGPCLNFSVIGGTQLAYQRSKPANGKNLTVIALIKVSALTVGEQGQIAGNLEVTANNDGWSFQHSNVVGQEGIRLVLGDGTSTLLGEAEAVGNSIIIDRWTLVAASYNVTTKIKKLYIDGKLLDTTTTGSTGNTPTVGSTFTIGGDNVTNFLTNSRIAWVSIFDSDLPQEDIEKWGRGDDDSVYFDDEPIGSPFATFFRSVSDTITLVETRTRASSYGRRGVDFFAPFESYSETKVQERDATDTLTTVEDYFGKRVVGADTEALTTTETFTGKRVIHRSCGDHITLTETASTKQTLHRSCGDTLPLYEGAPKVINGIDIIVPGYIGTLARRYTTLQGFGTAIVLPSPLFGDSEANGDLISVFRSETNKRFISIKRQDMRTLHYEFEVTRQKALELRNFIKHEIDNNVTLTNWKGEIWIGNIVNNPFEMEMAGRWGPCTEKTHVILELKAVRVH